MSSWPISVSRRQASRGLAMADAFMRSLAQFSPVALPSTAIWTSSQNSSGSTCGQDDLLLRSVNVQDGGLTHALWKSREMLGLIVRNTHHGTRQKYLRS